MPDKFGFSPAEDSLDTWVDMLSKQGQIPEEKLKERVGIVRGTETRGEDFREKWVEN